MMDAKQAEDLKSSSLWTKLIEEVDHRILCETRKLRSCSPGDLVSIQLKIDALESLRMIPNAVIERESR